MAIFGTHRGRNWETEVYPHAAEMGAAPHALTVRLSDRDDRDEFVYLQMPTDAIPAVIAALAGYLNHNREN